jgi:hypothetical protein
MFCTVVYGCLVVLIGRWLFAGTPFQGWRGLVRLGVIAVYAVSSYVTWVLLFSVFGPTGQPVAPFRSTPSLNLLFVFACLPMLRVLMAPPQLLWLLITLPGSLLYLGLLVITGYLLRDPLVLVGLGIASTFGALSFEKLFIPANEGAGEQAQR